MKSSVWFCSVSALLAVARVASGHAHVCEHEHIDPFPKLLIRCDPAGEDCKKDSRQGICTNKQTSSRAWCQCVCPRTGCSAGGSNAFNPDIPGLPGPGDLLTYTAVFDPINYWAVFADGELVAEFEAGDEALQGIMELTYGSFEEPTQVPVTITDVQLSLPSVIIRGMETGPNLLTLPPEGPQELVYDSTTGWINPLGEPEGIALALSNNLGSGLEAVWYFEARIDPPDGRALLQGDGVAFGPTPPPVPLTSGWAMLTTATIVLLAGAWMIRRGQRTDAPA